MLKITILLLTTYAVVLAFIDPTAGGETIRSHGVHEIQEKLQNDQLFVADKVFNSMVHSDSEDCSCNLDKCCDAKLCCTNGQRCCWNSNNPGTFYCC